MTRETQPLFQEVPEAWILPLTGWLTAQRGDDLDLESPCDCLPTDHEPSLTTEDFDGWDTMIMALMA